MNEETTKVREVNIYRVVEEIPTSFKIAVGKFALVSGVIVFGLGFLLGALIF